MSRLERWEARTELALAVAAVAFLLAYALPIVWQGTPTPARSWCRWVITVTWVAFGIDYVIRFVIAEHRWAFVKHNVIDLFALALPVLRPLRLLRLVALLAVLNRVGSTSLRGRVVTYVVGGTSLLVITGALAVTDAERGQPGANIANFGDGVWWAFATITTVGYGDRHPVTTTGRAVAIGLMVGGIALLGVVTATLASWLVERVAAETEAEEAATRHQVEELADQIRELRAALEASPRPVRDDDS
ncbi:MAG: potassium channel family protein [Promicromonosporaceae bacterium]|nr:potassium channel family protein [Promicromonosporaceae bacterium]